MHPLLPLIPAALGLLIGWALLAWSSRLDTRGYVYRRAPKLPVRALSAHDDAWIRGKVEPGPDGLLEMPRFGHPCVAYTYKIEEKRTRTVRDSNGNTRTESYWTTVHSDAASLPFHLNDGTGAVLVRPGQADTMEGLPGERDSGFSRRYSGTYLPPAQTMTVLGVLEDDGSFGPKGEIPLVITSRTRAAKVKSNDRTETFGRRLAFFVAWLGAAFSYGIHIHPAPPGPLPWIITALVGLALPVPMWCITTYNRFVRLRQQRQASWRQIDVDLATRAALVPNLVQVIQAYQEHETDLLQQLGALRAAQGETAAIAGEQAAHNAAMGFLALREDYPELQSNDLFMDLHERLWAIEEKLAASRSLHNRILQEWNDLVQSVPSNLLATLLGHKPAQRFAVDRAGDPEITKVPSSNPIP